MTMDQLRAYYGNSPRTAGASSVDEERYSTKHLPNGSLVRCSAGTCFVIETARPLTTFQGLHRLREVESVQASSFGALMRESIPTGTSLRDAVFLDTETTGLGVGAGTYIFLVGAGYVRDDTFVVKQFFLRGPHEEGAFLDVLGEFLGNFSIVVSFNGRAFDLPLLESRYIRNRREIPVINIAHLDLLHPARRLWKHRLASCALKELENHILGVNRPPHDVPGRQIPEMYFRYQRTGDGRSLQRVFAHNVYDILSLAALSVHMPRVLERPFGGLVRDPRDFYALGKILETDEDLARAALCYEEVLRGSADMTLRSMSLVRLGFMHKRARNWPGAIEAWTRLLDQGGISAFEALVEQAKYYEHVMRDYDRALTVVHRALELLELRSTVYEQAEKAALEHRYQRLILRASKLRLAG